jgi:beta-glucosidase
MSAEPYRDPTRDVSDRVDDLLSRMTLLEKLAQLGGVWSTDLLDGGRFSPEWAGERLAHGIGHVTRIGAATGLRPAESAALANELQAFLRDQTRLGIPAIVHEEACGGYMARDATCFPHAISQAATWDPALVGELARVIRDQMRAVGAHHALAPVLDVARDPRWGRVEETYGEDPYLISRIGSAFIRGLQGERLSDGVVATAKHFLGYGLSEGGLNWAPVRLMPRELLEVVAAPFEAAIREAAVESVMNAYHELDGVPCGASRELMVTLLRERLGFDGVVVSDYFTLAMLLSYHRVAVDRGDAARLGLEAGIDVELPAHDCYGAPLRAALEDGRVDPELVDASVRRLLLQKVRLGLFEDPFVDAERAPLVFDTPEQRALAHTAAHRSLVLLHDDAGLLPLSPTLSRIAVIGPGADDVRLLQGDYHYPAHVEVMFESQGDLPAPTPMIARRREDLAEHLPPMTSILAAIREAMHGARADADAVTYARGCDVIDSDTSGFDEAVAAAAGAEVALLVVGDRSGLTDDATCGEARDRADIGLPGVQTALVEAVAATGTPVVLLLLGGRPIALGDIKGRVGAAMALWLPGAEGGPAVADVLFGRVEPGGRLPISFPRSSAQLPVYYGHKPSGGRSHWKGDYVDGPTTPLYPFGHGLGYTSFVFEDLSIEPAEVPAEGRVRIACSVRNTGARAGEEVVQLYLRDPVASVTRPVQELKGFARVSLEPDARQRVTFELEPALMAFYDLDMRLVVEPGEIEVMLGASSTDVRLRGAFRISGETTPVRERALASRVTLG